MSAAHDRIQLAGEPPVTLTPDSLHSHVGPSPWLVVVPHDDDLVLGSGLLLTLAAERGIPCHVAVCTDGALGYEAPEQRDGIKEVRQRELVRAAQLLGLPVEHIHFLGFPDGSLAQRMGARGPDEPPGLAQALTALMRQVSPRVVLSCHDRDVHPDHRAVAWETAIACFWASGRQWLELGAPIEPPSQLQYGVYVGFDSNPDVRVIGGGQGQRRKLAALAAFESQPIIESLVERVRAGGAEEFFRRTPLPPHTPASYRAAFAIP